MENLLKGKTSAKPNSLPKSLSLKIQGKDIPHGVKIPKREYNGTAGTKGHWTYFSTNMNLRNAINIAKFKALPTTFQGITAN